MIRLTAPRFFPVCNIAVMILRSLRGVPPYLRLNFMNSFNAASNTIASRNLNSNMSSRELVLQQGLQDRRVDNSPFEQFYRQDVSAYRWRRSENKLLSLNVVVSKVSQNKYLLVAFISIGKTGYCGKGWCTMCSRVH